MAQRRLSFDQPTPLRVTPVTPAQLNRIRQVDLGDVVKSILGAIPPPPGSTSFTKQDAKFSGSERDLPIVWRSYHYTVKRYAVKTSTYVEALFGDDIPLVRADDGSVVEEDSYFVKEANRLLFEMLLDTTAGDAHTMVMEFCDTEDGRRALMSLRHKYGILTTQAQVSRLFSQLRSIRLDGKGDPSQVFIHFNDLVTRIRQADSTAISDTVVRQMLRDMCKNDAYSSLVVKMD